MRAKLPPTAAVTKEKASPSKRSAAAPKPGKLQGSQASQGLILQPSRPILVSSSQLGQVASQSNRSRLQSKERIQRQSRRHRVRRHHRKRGRRWRKAKVPESLSQSSRRRLLRSDHSARSAHENQLIRLKSRTLVQRHPSRLRLQNQSKREKKSRWQSSHSRSQRCP